MSKSEIILAGRVENMEGLAVEHGCNIGFLASTYLGLPLGVPHNSVGAWDFVEERFHKRLAPWKRQYISKGGRTTMVHSTFSSLTFYYLSLFWMSKVVCKRLERIPREFLWGKGNLGKKSHLVKWKTVCTEKKRGCDDKIRLIL